jgi:hypothetical protein
MRSGVLAVRVRVCVVNQARGMSMMAVTANMAAAVVMTFRTWNLISLISVSPCVFLFTPIAYRGQVEHT